MNRCPFNCRESKDLTCPVSVVKMRQDRWGSEVFTYRCNGCGHRWEAHKNAAAFDSTDVGGGYNLRLV